jgi:hypothetical protein
VAHHAHLLGREFGSGPLDQNQLDQLSEALSSIEEVVDEIDQEYVKEEE